jgi:hypothetical protein
MRNVRLTMSGPGKEQISSTRLTHYILQMRIAYLQTNIILKKLHLDPNQRLTSQSSRAMLERKCFHVSRSSNLAWKVCCIN